ncbi:MULTISPECIES: hypothetical protein [unclassified Streptomyces]|uniref:hypothetical protein n=1 Tax=unclassified Streptomyces TaxID=2593676 RepID=UPI002E2E87E6|nr:hypothetical protein [Streptomyces sp. NBC_01439]
MAGYLGGRTADDLGTLDAADLIRSDEPAGTPVCDYTRTLRELPEAEWDLAISLYAGPVCEHVARCLKPGGWLLANNSHADAGLAHVNPAYRLAAAIHHRAGRYRLTTDDLERYLLPKTPPHPTREQLHATGRGIAYTHPATAYIFQRVPHGQSYGREAGLRGNMTPATYGNVTSTVASDDQSSSLALRRYP